jgi:hypothetical protein
MKPKSAIDLLGIRHHGPGSARSLLRRLTDNPPDLLLIEGPPDADHLIARAAHADMMPPVAMLVYNPKQLQQAAFYPFAEFSPEWQAILFAIRRNIPARFMDLPMSHTFVLQEDGAPAFKREDPFSAIAALAGYTDPERWWESMVEYGAAKQEADSAAPFSTVLELMDALRSAKETPESTETLLREAWMRQTLRAAQKEGFGKIAVVCGAWHAPALQHLDKIRATEDAALLKGLKKVRTEATWIPWSFDRLAFGSGYRAGVVSPAWYQILWDGFQKNTAYPHSEWLTRAARLLRGEGLDTSSAHVIEAARLADTLAVLRGTLLPGIDELREAAVTVLGNGSDRFLELIDRQLITGDQFGKVPASLPTAPLKADFEQLARSCRLARNTFSETLQLDLRKEAHLQKSRLLHRLILMDIPWGALQPMQEGKHGAFHEVWTLQWQVEFEIRLIEAGSWGNTVEEAAGNLLQHKIQNTETLAVLVSLLDALLKSDLPQQLPALVAALQSASALATDALLLADAVLPMVETWRYGNARELDMSVLRQLIGQIIPRVCIRLPDACLGMNEEAAAELLKKIVAVNRAIGLLHHSEFDDNWAFALLSMCEMADTAPLLSGFAFRLRFDKKHIDPAGAATALQFHLSAAQPPLHGALWLEGFLQGSSLLLLHHPALWRILDDWIAAMPEAHFVETLPLLRRSFSRFSGPEREKILLQSKTGAQTSAERRQEEWDTARTRPVEELLRLLLE